ncbi:MAG: Cytochrome c oxidase subunit CcoP, partial [Myxococcaceae bacterium]|nr:Cytochrome c oxidase subunit CcoP [Myxococcaceae bacterium]
AEAATAAARVARGRAHYLRYCALCHGREAQGYAADHANALGNQDFLATASPAFLRAAIANGRPGTTMSAWGSRRGGPLDDRKVDDLVAYLRSLARRPLLATSARASTGDVAAGGRVFLERCSSCHGDRGQGSNIATSLSNPAFLHTVRDGYLRNTILRGRAGTPMLSFASLGPRVIDELTVFIRSAEHVPGPPPPPTYEPPPGLDHLVINPAGQPPAFTLRDDRFVPAAQVAQALEQHRRLIILDARATSDWSTSHIAGALPFPFYNIEQMAERLPRDGTWILAYCACPHAASGHVVDELRRRNFPHAAVIDEGWIHWSTHNLPTAHAAIVPNP